MDNLNDIRKEIAYRRWQLTGCEDKDINWKIAGNILIHFLHRRPGSYYWEQEHEDYSLYADLVGDQNEPNANKPLGGDKSSN